MKPRPPHSQLTRSGFTMIELLVAVSVLSLMLSLAAQIFYTAQVGVQMGTQTSQIINEQRAISQPLFDDFRNMNVFESVFGGNSPGFLAIVQENKTGVRFPNAEDRSSDSDSWVDFFDINGNGTQDAGENDIVMRSDQIAFFRDAQGLNSLTPGTESDFDSMARAPVARIWYGHTSPFTGGSASIEPGTPGNDISSQLTLGRQALLLVEGSASSNFPDGEPGDTAHTVDSRHIDNESGFLSSNTDLYLGSRDVLDLNTFLASTSPFNFNRTNGTLYNDGGNDVTSNNQFSLFSAPGWNPTVTVPVTPPSFFEGFLGTPSELNMAGPAPRWDPDARLTTINYAEEALRWAYVNPGTRLQTAKNLSTDFSAGIFTAEQIGRQHANFSPHMADFAIEFAADWVDDGVVGVPDNEPDRDEAGNIVWYTALNANPDGDGGSGSIRGDGTYDGIGSNRNEPVTYGVPFSLPAFDGTTATIPNPFAYVVSGAGLTQATASNTSGTDRVFFVWSHSGDDPETDDVWSTQAAMPAGTRYVEGAGKYWPYLVRFRYRLMDGKGDFRSVQPDRVNAGDEFRVVGRWFEQIVPVKRPTGLF